MAPGTNKAAGLHVLLEALQLSMAEVCAIGDSENDLETHQEKAAAQVKVRNQKKQKHSLESPCARTCCNPSAWPAPWAMPLANVSFLLSSFLVVDAY